jgi:hypothetical protein
MVASSAIATVGGAMLNRKANRSGDAAADAAATQAQIGLDQWEHYKETYQPLEKSLVTEAQSYDTPENFAKAAGDASATVSSQFGKARERLARTPGLDPSSPAYAATLADLDGQQAAVDATQQNAARQRVQDMAWARKVDALGLGKGLPAQASTTLASAAQTNSTLAQAAQRRGDATAAGLGTLATNVIDKINRSSGGTTTTDPTYGTGMSGRGFDFSDNMQEFGI